MGIVDWFKRGVGEMMVARPDDAKSHVVWKHPDSTIERRVRRCQMAPMALVRPLAAFPHPISFKFRSNRCEKICLGSAIFRYLKITPA